MAETRFVTSRWLWSPFGANPINGNPLDRWVEFKKTIRVPASTGPLRFTIACEGRYHLWVNGGWIGEGPARSWPDEFFFDTHDLTRFTNNGDFEIRVLIRHSVPGTTNYISGNPGFAAEVISGTEGNETLITVTDSSWLCAESPAHCEPIVKMSNGLGYGEVVRADFAYNESSRKWTPPRDYGSAMNVKRSIIPRDIPALSETLVSPVGIVAERNVLSVGFVRSVNLRPLVFPGETDVNKHKRFSGVLETVIRCQVKTAGEIGITFDPHDTEPLAFFVGETRYVHANGKRFPIHLSPGDTPVRLLIRGEYHDPVFHLHFILPENCALVSPLPGEQPTPFVFIGPFTKTAHLQVSEPIPSAATEVPAEAELLSLAGIVGAQTRAASGPGPQTISVPVWCVSAHHVALESLSATPQDIPDCDFFRAETAVPCTFPKSIPRTDSTARQILWDFGREVSGFIEFRIRSSEGTRLDFFCFESMHDGLIEHAYSLNNSFRYFCANGDNSYISFQRRGFRYILMTSTAGSASRETFDSETSVGKDLSVELLSLSVRERLYPTVAPGGFSCSDAKLNRIYEISRRTVALCMEDTYVDCPAYEQTYWTGDTRNSALYSYYLFGAYPLFLRSARLAARSLERSPLFESTVPSAWQNVIPAWSFFHVIAGTEYLFYSGDSAGFRAIYPSLLKNMENAAAMRNVIRGEKLFALHAWNMLDWAPMDVKDDSIPAHQNAEFVLACRKLALAARSEGFSDDAERLDTWANETAASIENRFWSEESGAYRDSLKRDGTPSKIFSVQTQMMTCLAGIPDSACEGRLKEHILNPPATFVRIGSPFVRHFLFELLLRWGREDLILAETKRIWGEMLDKGATTCWEGWEFISGHYTRSHCHAWSAAPALFLPIIVLGIMPEEIGFTRVVIKPYPGNLTHAEGIVPTPLGSLTVSWHISEGCFNLSASKPETMQVSVTVPEGLERGAIIIQ